MIFLFFFINLHFQKKKMEENIYRSYFAWIIHEMRSLLRWLYFMESAYRPCKIYFKCKYKKIKLRKIVYWLVSYGYKAKLKTGQARRAPIKIRTHWTELTLSTYSHAFIRHENWLSPNLDMRLVQWSVPRKDKSVLRVRIRAQFIIGLICLLRLISFFHVI